MTELRRVRIDNFGLLVQTQKGAIQRINLNRPQIDVLKSSPASGLDSLRTSFTQLNGMFDASGALSARIDIADEPADSLTRPLRIYYGIEPGCNLSCSFCGPRDLEHESERTTQEREGFLLNQIAEAGTFQVQLTGGEIFIRGFKLLPVLQRTSELGMGTMLGTNGVWNHIKERESFIDELAAFDHILEIKVSVDGTREYHDSVRGPGTYDQAVRTLRDLSERGFNTRINTTIFKDSCSLDQIEHVARLAKEVGANLQAIPERSCGRAEGKTEYQLPSPADLFQYTLRAKQLREELGIGISFNFDIFGGGRQLPTYDPERPFSCGAGLWGFAVTHQGAVYPCGFTQDIGKGTTFLAGVINEEHSLLDIWLNSSVLFDWRHAGKSSTCRSCEDYIRSCWGGCMVQAYLMHGSLSAEDPYCLKDFKQ